MIWLILHLLKQRETPPPPSRPRRGPRVNSTGSSANATSVPEPFRSRRFRSVEKLLRGTLRGSRPIETTEEFLSRLAREDTRLLSRGAAELCGFLTTSEELKFGHRADAAGLALPLSRQARQLLGLSESVNAPSRQRER